MRKYISIFAAALLLVSCQTENPSGEGTAGEPVVTAEATEITPATAVLSGYARPSKDARDVKFGIVCSTNKNPTVDNGQVVEARELDGNNRFSCKVSGLLIAQEYYFRAFLKENGSYLYGKATRFTTQDFPARPLEAVDMGLSVKWASCNVGASNPFEYGDYFAWGETQTKEDYSAYTYKWGQQADHFTKYNLEDGKVQLDPVDDAASVRLGGKWRMPTYDEFRELLNCPRTKTGRGGVEGFLITGPSGNSIFMPAGGERIGTSIDTDGGRGCYWTSTLRSPNSYYAWLGLMNSNMMVMYSLSRNHGQSVRAVVD